MNTPLNHQWNTSVLFIFVDGVGMGEESKDNPFFSAHLPTFVRLFGSIPTLQNPELRGKESLLIPIAATLGIPGLPLSGTGQATLLTGVNCSEVHRSHFGPYPPSTVRPLLNEKSLFRLLGNRELPTEFVNAYPQRYFDYYDAHPAMMAAFASAFLSAGKPLHRVEEIESGTALSADITGSRWQEMGYAGIPSLTPREAGINLAAITKANAFTSFEYFLTDKAGHKQNMSDAIDALQRLDGMLGGALEALDTTRALIIITSDHGNVENLATPSHTRNPVPLIAIGAGHEQFAECRSLMDVAPTIVGMFPE